MSSPIPTQNKDTWKGKTRGGLLGYRIFVFFLKNFNISLSYFVLRFVALYFVITSPKSTKAIYKYYHNILHLPVLNSFFKVYKNYYAFGQVILDKLTLSAGITKQFTYDFDGEEHLKKLTNGDSPGMLISAHVGNWDMARYLLNRLNAKFNLVMLDAEHQKIKKFLTNIRNPDALKNVNIIVVKDDMSHIFELNNAMKNKEIICFHADRYVKGGTTLAAKLFGNDVSLPSGPFAFATRFKVPVSFVFAMKAGAKHYHFYATEAKVYSKGVDEMLGDFTAILQDMLNRYPEQWFNYYDFFKAVA